MNNCKDLEHKTLKKMYHVEFTLADPEQMCIESLNVTDFRKMVNS